MSAYWDKLIEKLDKLDPSGLHVQFVRLAQERGLMDAVFQAIQEGVVVVDRNGRVMYANRAAEMLMGFSMESARGRSARRYLKELEIEWDRVLELEEDEWAKIVSREIEVTYPDHRYVSFYAVPLESGTEGERSLLLILRDVSKERIQESTQLESERLNAVQLLASGVAHEIGNPLNALNIHLQLLEREMGDSKVEQREDLREYVSIARAEVSRLDMIITQFLKALRPTQPDLKPTGIRGLLEEMLTLLRRDAEDRAIRVEVEYAEPIPTVMADAGQIKQAFFNIARNAVQAMRDGGELRISVSATDHLVRIAFKDSGCGIAPEDFGKIFEPYHTTKAKGSGLGLMIVQRIVRDHGGQLEIQSKPGEGTLFTIVLPLAERRVRLLNSARSWKRKTEVEGGGHGG